MSNTSIWTESYRGYDLDALLIREVWIPYVNKTFIPHKEFSIKRDAVRFLRTHVDKLIDGKK